MPEIYYANDTVQSQCENKDDKQLVETLRRLKENDLRSGNNLEKISHDPLVLSVRIDEKRRLEITYDAKYKDENGRLNPIVLVYDDGHQYDENAIKAAHKSINTEQFKAKIQAKLQTQNRTIVEEHLAGEVRMMGTRPYVLDEYQRSVTLPACVEGAAGTGKTTVAFSQFEEFLKNIQEGQCILYVAKSKELIEEIKDNLAQSRFYDEAKHKKQVHILSYEELMRSRYPGLKFEEDPKGCIEEWLKTTPGIIGKNVKEPKRSERAGLMYNEFRIISGLENPDDYLKDNEMISPVSKDARPDILNAYKQWKLEDKRYYIEFTPIENAQAGYDFIAVDEGQDLSYRQLKNIRNLGKIENGQFLVCHDPKQQLEGHGRLDKYLNIPTVRLEKSYRCPPKVMSFAKDWNDLRVGLVKIGKSEGKINGTTLNKEGNGLLVWFDSKDRESHLERIKYDTEAYIIADEEDQQKLFARGFSRVYTVGQIKGLGKRRIYLYEPFKKKSHGNLNKAVTQKNEGAAIDKEENIKLGPQLCAIFTSVTRSEHELGIIQTSAEGVEALVEFSKSKCLDKSEVTKKAEIDIENSKQNARENFNQGNLEQAKRILINDVFKDDPQAEKKAVNEMEQWKKTDAKQGEIQQFNKKLSQSVLDKNWNGFCQLVSDGLFVQSRPEDKRIELLKETLIDLINGYSEDKRDELMRVFKFILEKIGKNIQPTSAQDIEILSAGHQVNLSCFITNSPYYDNLRAFEFFRTMNAGALFLNCFLNGLWLVSKDFVEQKNGARAVLKALLGKVSEKKHPDEILFARQFYRDVISSAQPPIKKNAIDKLSTSVFPVQCLLVTDFYDCLESLARHDLGCAAEVASQALSKLRRGDYSEDAFNLYMNTLKEMNQLYDSLKIKHPLGENPTYDDVYVNLFKTEEPYKIFDPRLIVSALNLETLELYQYENGQVDTTKRKYSFISALEKVDYFDNDLELSLYLMNDVNLLERYLEKLLAYNDPACHQYIFKLLIVCLTMLDHKKSQALVDFTTELGNKIAKLIPPQKTNALMLALFMSSDAAVNLTISSPNFDLGCMHRLISGTYPYKQLMRRLVKMFSNLSEEQLNGQYYKSSTKFLQHVLGSSTGRPLEGVNTSDLLTCVHDFDTAYSVRYKIQLMIRSDLTPESAEKFADFCHDAVRKYPFDEEEKKTICKYANDCYRHGLMLSGAAKDKISIARITIKLKNNPEINNKIPKQNIEPGSSSSSQVSCDISSAWDKKFSVLQNLSKTMTVKTEHINPLIEMILENPQFLSSKIELLMSSSLGNINWNYTGKSPQTKNRTLLFVLLYHCLHDFDEKRLPLLLLKKLIEDTNIDIYHMDSAGYNAFAYAIISHATLPVLEIFFASKKFDFIQSISGLSSIVQNYTIDKLLLIPGVQNFLNETHLDFIQFRGVIPNKIKATLATTMK